MPCEYQVLRRNGDVQWLPSSASQLLDDDTARNCLATFELRYPRDALWPCNSVEDYSDVDGYEPPDEYPLALHQDLADCLRLDSICALEKNKQATTGV
jgi:hypothetical protein